MPRIAPGTEDIMENSEMCAIIDLSQSVIRIASSVRFVMFRLGSIDKKIRSTSQCEISRPLFGDVYESRQRYGLAFNEKNQP